VRDFLQLPQNASLCFSSPKRPNRLWDPLSLLFNRHLHSVSRLKCPGLGFNCTYPSDAEVKNEWSITAAPSVCLYAVYRDILTPMYDIHLKFLSDYVPYLIVC